MTEILESPIRKKIIDEMIKLIITQLNYYTNSCCHKKNKFHISRKLCKTAGHYQHQV